MVLSEEKTEQIKKLENNFDNFSYQMFCLIFGYSENILTVL